MTTLEAVLLLAAWAGWFGFGWMWIRHRLAIDTIEIMQAEVREARDTVRETMGLYHDVAQAWITRQQEQKQ